MEVHCPFLTESSSDDSDSDRDDGDMLDCNELPAPEVSDSELDSPQAAAQELIAATTAKRRHINSRISPPNRQLDFDASPYENNDNDFSIPDSPSEPIHSLKIGSHSTDLPFRTPNNNDDNTSEEENETESTMSELSCSPDPSSAEASSDQGNAGQSPESGGRRSRGIRRRGGRVCGRGIRCRGGGSRGCGSQSAESQRSKSRSRGRGRPRGSRSTGRRRGRGRGRGRGIRNREQLDLGLIQDENQSDSEEGNEEHEGLGWDNESRPYREFLFTGIPGINVFPEDGTCPLETLKLFLTDDLINSLVTHTNTYADIMKNTPQIQEKMNTQNRNIFNLWVPVTFDEMWTYLAVSSIMGILGKPKYDLFWSKDPFISTPIFSRLMRRDRYTQIRKMIHFTDPADEDPEDPMRKLSTYLDVLLACFKEVYTPEQNVAVDEYLSLWKGRLKFRVYIPNKRERYGVKVYMLCESASAYLYSFKVYSGSGKTYSGSGKTYPEPNGIELPKPYEEYSTYSKVVLSLMDGLYDDGYCVTLDNLYTEPYLLLALYANNTDGFGTLRKKSGLPHDFWYWKPQKGLGIPPIVQYHDKKLMILRWNDWQGLDI